MAEEQTENNSSETSAVEKERFDISFGNGALKKLKELANYLSISEDRLGDILVKGMKIIDAVKDAGEDKIIIETKDGKRETINIRDL
ncbi:MAG: hypothetical protein A2445_05665 [Candidatus Jacksonbacteria bacterium RIFOXYC2_FULL_44_29]|nr:MAG: hypothetical protein UW45_C0008G0015 [Parcubacteria group bacterium GW2011_GWC2_44_22]OGY76001.1 MAG: hypothetical protein A2240_05510 [Candidatus Jacksonbacteria bacterium RIFOXYA2_FULL_43_12]OGY76767.1 MAG: hypothetical protein A2295_00310 [Candidatus Jacksonbacteria bacterium RIFOXYB2_FULL_44_15]OGY79174.1 MAG: hypothetical protein A2445_05665 [Candidatus Jacksonbacteria bacterium RIFOXYC2_FULL_44_29]OGY82107.1 MAG: hypothetical protein A2550_00215 [Candidatus Jacksonbacteria bacteri